MSRGLWEYLQGSVLFEVEGGTSAEFLQRCTYLKIPIYDICATPLGFSARVPARYYAQLRRPAHRCRCRLHLKERFGIRFAFTILRGRIGLLIGFVLAVTILLSFPHLIWNIEFYRFTPSEQEEMRRHLYTMGVYEGAFIDSEEIARLSVQLRAQDKQYSWVALNFVKGRLMVEKRPYQNLTDLTNETPSNLVARSEGIIRYMNVRGGYYQVEANQSVQKDQLLVLGANNENGEGRVSYMHAEGEIYAEIEKDFEITIPLQETVLLQQSNVKTYHQLLLFGAKIPLGAKAPASQDNQMRIVTRHALAPFGFNLPATIERVTIREKSPNSITRSESLAAEMARTQAINEIQQEFGDFKILDIQQETQLTQTHLVANIHIRFLGNIAKPAPFEGLPQEMIEREQKR